jgi:hypothetical protein
MASNTPIPGNSRTATLIPSIGRNESEAVLLCVEAKQEKISGAAQTQLLTYLAICRHARRASRKPVPGIQGFLTDRWHYEFYLYLTSEGALHTSLANDTKDLKQLKIVYNFIIRQVVAAIDLSPTTTPVRGTTSEKRQAVLAFERESF